MSSNRNAAVEYASIKAWMGAWVRGWNRFWFAPRLPHTLAVIRICCGSMLTYVHLIWLSRLSDFFGANAWINREASQAIHSQDWAWSWLWYTDNLAIVGAHQVLAITASLMMAVGLFSRLSIPAAWLLTLMVCHRQTLALFGLDQIVIMLSMYLIFSNCGSIWSLDARLRERFGTNWLCPRSDAFVRNNVVTRLIQLHLCIIYLFGGLSKMRGEMWFDGSALWYTIVNYEYQSLDLTWLGRSRITIASLTAATIFWETFYCALIWPKLTRPLTLAMAVFVHAGIALGLGMITFGFIMIVANFAFIEPESVRRWSPRNPMHSQAAS